MNKTILKERTKLIKNENRYLSFYSKSQKISEFQRDSKIDSIFEDKLHEIKTGIAREKYELKFGRSKKILNNEKVIKKYWGKKESKLFEKIVLKYGLIEPYERGAKRIFKIILGETEYDKLHNEFVKRYCREELINGPGNATTFFLASKINKINSKLRFKKNPKIVNIVLRNFIR